MMWSGFADSVIFIRFSEWPSLCLSQETELIILEVIWSWYFEENSGLNENADEVLH